MHGKYYEIQIADSFGDNVSHASCGGVYFRLAPLQRASLPAGKWQTFDITFHAPRLNNQRRVSHPARFTLLHNGITVHDNARIPEEGVIRDPEFAKPAGIVLEDQDFPVRFRNIWVVDLATSERLPK